MKWYFKVIYHYFDFSGRSRRKEFWIFTLFSAILTLLLSFLDAVFETYIFTTIFFMYYLVMFIPSLSLLLRRLHDSGKSGWFLFVILIPIIGWIWLLVLLCSDSENGPNKWGENPKGAENDRLINQIGKE
jgi:uncharacterized membrane protein YhaH (DUF805 family)